MARFIFGSAVQLFLNVLDASQTVRSQPLSDRPIIHSTKEQENQLNMPNYMHHKHTNHATDRLCTVFVLHCSPAARRTGGGLSGGDLPRGGDQRVADPGVGEHGGRESLAAGVGGEPDRV